MRPSRRSSQAGDQTKDPRDSREPLIITGPLDQYAAEGLRLETLPFLDGESDATLKLNQVDGLHAASLQVLLALQRDLGSKGRRVILKSVQPGVRRLFQISGTEQFFTFLDDSQ